MAKRLKPVDVVTIGVGLTGSLMALELARTGLKVVGIERGAPRFTVPDFQSPAIHDELRFSIRKAMMQDNVKEAVTFRNSSDQTALPIRRWESFLPGTGLGGSFVHWNGQSFRFQVADFIYKTHIEQRYGKKILDPELTIQDWGVTYDELEPHYDRFEYLCGHQRQGRQHQGHHSAGRQSVRSAARARISDAADEGALFRRPVPQRRRKSRISSLPAAIIESEPALHQSRRSRASAMRLLRILRALCLRTLRQSQPADGHSARALEESKL